MFDAIEIASRDLCTWLKRTRREKNAVRWSQKKVVFCFQSLLWLLFFRKRGSSEEFNYDLAEATQTGNCDNLIDTI